MQPYSTGFKFGENNQPAEFAIKTRHQYCDIYQVKTFFQLLHANNFQSKAVFYSTIWFR